MINERTLENLEARGLDPELLVHMGIESCSPRTGAGRDWIKIPYLRGDLTVNHKYRSTAGEKAFSQDKDGEQIFWNWNVIADTTLADLPIICVEGEIDALAAIQAGFVRTVSVPNGAPQEPVGEADTAKYRYLETAPVALRDAKEIILAVDSDNAGHNLLEDLSLRLGRYRCKWVPTPDGCKDLGDVLRLHGTRAVAETIARAKWMRVDGVYRMSELPPLPVVTPLDCGIKGLEQHYRIRTGDFCVVLGTPGHGKTAIVNDIACRMADRYHWPIAFASFEQRPQRDHRRALRTWFNRKLEKDQNKAELQAADAWIDRMFTFLVPSEDDDVTLAWVLERLETAVVRYGCKMVVVDPFNEMDHERPRDMSETEYTGYAIKQFKKFAKKYAVHFVVVVHPAKMRRGDDGKIPIPNLYDANGSSHWYNKPDCGIIVHRDATGTLIRVAKSRYHTEIGVPGDYWANYDISTGRYTPRP